MSIQFYDREEELKVIENEIKSPKASLIIIFGRRRIGKTTLVLKALENFKHNYIYVENQNVNNFLDKCTKSFNQEFRSLDDFFEFIFKTSLKEKIILVIDEYQRLAKKISAKIQYYWDIFFNKSKLKLILLGSTIGMIERDISYTGPLYGRATKIIKLNGFDYRTVRLMFKGFDEREIIKIFSIFGGTPYYLTLVNKAKNLEKNIFELFIKKGAILYEEIERLLSYELRELGRYLSILEALSKGKLTLKEISDFTKLERFQTKKYMYVLEKLGIIRKELSIAKSKVPRYSFVDNFFEFYMRFIYENKEFIESDQREFVLKKITEGIKEYYGKIFEKIALQTVSKALKGYKVGKYWDNEGNEIDILAIKDSFAIFFVCKFGKYNEADVKVFEKRAEEVAKKLKIKKFKTKILTPENLLKLKE
jgi:AAA+ ATPase superfamily predicted ATPase